MQLVTKNGWTLTEHTSKLLFEEFDGTEEELINYVSKHNIEHETFNKFSDLSGDYWAVKPRIFLGSYTLHPNSDGIVAIG